MFERQITSTLKLIAKYGTQVVWNQPRGSLPTDPQKPWDIMGREEATFLVNMLFLPVNRQEKAFLSYLREAPVPTGRELGYLGKSTFEPALQDVIIRDGVPMSVVNIDRIAPSGVPILYVVELAR